MCHHPPPQHNNDRAQKLLLKGLYLDIEVGLGRLAGAEQAEWVSAERRTVRQYRPAAGVRLLHDEHIALRNQQQPLDAQQVTRPENIKQETWKEWKTPHSLLSRVLVRSDGNWSFPDFAL